MDALHTDPETHTAQLHTEVGLWVGRGCCSYRVVDSAEWKFNFFPHRHRIRCSIQNAIFSDTRLVLHVIRVDFSLVFFDEQKYSEGQKVYNVIRYTSSARRMFYLRLLFFLIAFPPNCAMHNELHVSSYRWLLCLANPNRICFLACPNRILMQFGSRSSPFMCLLHPLRARGHTIKSKWLWSTCWCATCIAKFLQIEHVACVYPRLSPRAKSHSRKFTSTEIAPTGFAQTDLNFHFNNYFMCSATLAAFGGPI